MNNEYIKRNYAAEFRADGENGLIEGYPIVFNSPTIIGDYFREVIEAGAIAPEVISADADVKLFRNHDTNAMTIARTLIPVEKLGGMSLTADENGIKMVANPNRKRTDANDLYLAVEDGTCNGMSFMFRVSEEWWEGLDTDMPTRHITKIDPIIEVSAVNFPAYASTSISARGDKPTESDLTALENARKAEVPTENGAKTETRDAKTLSILKLYET